MGFARGARRQLAGDQPDEVQQLHLVRHGGTTTATRWRWSSAHTPTGTDTLQYEATMTDPKVFTRPWTIRMTLQRQKDIGLLDYECTAMLDELGIDHTWPRDFDEEK